MSSYIKELGRIPEIHHRNEPSEVDLARAVERSKPKWSTTFWQNKALVQTRTHQTELGEVIETMNVATGIRSYISKPK